nr:RNA-directed DNA polymerase, eukaryota [Tanacetum cinerariifolium]
MVALSYVGDDLHLKFKRNHVGGAGNNICQFCLIDEDTDDDDELSLKFKQTHVADASSQEFLVKSSRILIDNTILPKAEVPTRWLRVVPIKVNVHAWRVCLDKLATRANLSLRRMDIPSIACPLCNSAVEFSSHIFSLVPWLAKFGEIFWFGGNLKMRLLTPTTSGSTGLSIFVYISN